MFRPILPQLLRGCKSRVPSCLEKQTLMSLQWGKIVSANGMEQLLCAGNLLWFVLVCFIVDVVQLILHLEPSEIHGSTISTMTLKTGILQEVAPEEVRSQWLQGLYLCK